MEDDKLLRTISLYFYKIEMIDEKLPILYFKEGNIDGG